jgi:hypothetical protein
MAGFLNTVVNLRITLRGGEFLCQLRDYQLLRGFRFMDLVKCFMSCTKKIFKSLFRNGQMHPQQKFHPEI